MLEQVMENQEKLFERISKLEQQPNGGTTIKDGATDYRLQKVIKIAKKHKNSKHQNRKPGCEVGEFEAIYQCSRSTALRKMREIAIQNEDLEFIKEESGSYLRFTAKTTEELAEEGKL